MSTGQYHAWLAAGYHGEMGYLAHPDAVAKRDALDRVLPGVGCVLTVGINYHTMRLPPRLRDDPSRGIIASYAWGEDYHNVLVPRLRQLAEFVESKVGEPVASRAYVDTGPVLERELAARAGLGFVGKNTNLIHPRLGSWLFLGELLLAVDIGPPITVTAGPARDRDNDSSQGLAQLLERGTCGRCTRCLDACPTEAFVAPYVLDARRCISYLTIELKGPIPRHLRPLMGNRIFGCDICQEVCPWNRRFAQPTAETTFQPSQGSIAPPLLELMTLDDACQGTAHSFQQRFRNSPVKRAKRRGLLRNVAVALGNWGDPAAVPILARALHDPEPLIRGHAAWALGRIGTQRGRHALQECQRSEKDIWVREEMAQALQALA
jgi:epoxyqueuosine reductase